MISALHNVSAAAAVAGAGGYGPAVYSHGGQLQSVYSVVAAAAAAAGVGAHQHVPGAAYNNAGQQPVPYHPADYGSPPYAQPAYTQPPYQQPAYAQQPYTTPPPPPSRYYESAPRPGTPEPPNRKKPAPQQQPPVQYTRVQGGVPGGTFVILPINYIIRRLKSRHWIVN